MPAIEEAQAALDGWVEEYNHTREHQSLGDRPPIERFQLARRKPEELVLPTDEAVALEVPVHRVPRITRRVRSDGRVSLLRFNYHVGRWLAGETVDLVSQNGLIEIFHRDVLVATHARRHLAEQDADLGRHPTARPAKPASTGTPVSRKVDHGGSISFAGWSYRVGNAYKRLQVDVAVVRDSVQISVSGKLLRTHPVRRPKKGAWCIRQSRWQTKEDQCGVEPSALCRLATGANPSPGYRRLTWGQIGGRWRNGGGLPHARSRSLLMPSDCGTLPFRMSKACCGASPEEAEGG